MIKLLQLLFIGHEHRWKVIKVQDIYSPRNNRRLPIATQYTMQCEHCGNIKEKSV